MPRLIINGEATEFADGDFPPTATSLLERYKLAPDSIIVEIDAEIVPADKLGAFTLKPESRIELVRYVGGG